jgi:hypothetical protein
VYDGIKAQILSEIKEEVSKNVSDFTKKSIDALLTEEEVIIGGSFDKEPEKYKLGDYVKKTIKDQFTTVKVKSQNSWDKDRIETVDIKEYVKNNIIKNDLKNNIDNEISKIKNEFNSQIKQVFEQKMKDIMSEVAFDVLKTNANFKEVKKQLGV